MIPFRLARGPAPILYELEENTMNILEIFLLNKTELYMCWI